MNLDGFEVQQGDWYSDRHPKHPGLVCMRCEFVVTSWGRLDPGESRTLVQLLSAAVEHRLECE